VGVLASVLRWCWSAKSATQTLCVRLYERVSSASLQAGVPAPVWQPWDRSDHSVQNCNSPGLVSFCWPQCCTVHLHKCSNKITSHTGFTPCLTWFGVSLRSCPISDEQCRNSCLKRGVPQSVSYQTSYALLYLVVQTLDNIGSDQSSSAKLKHTK
jgi:hypothetical protein